MPTSLNLQVEGKGAWVLIRMLHGLLKNVRDTVYTTCIHKYMYNIISETIQLKIEWKELQQKVSIALENQNALYSITL